MDTPFHLTMNELCENLASLFPAMTILIKRAIFYRREVIQKKSHLQTQLTHGGEPSQRVVQMRK